MDQLLPAKVHEASQKTLVHYSTQWQEAGLTALWFLALSMTPYAMAFPFIIMEQMSGGAYSCALNTLFTALGLIAFTAPAIAFLSDNRLVIDESGISFPRSLALMDFFSRHYSWDRITNVRLQAIMGNSLEDSHLKILTDMHTFEIELKRLKQQDKKSLIAALNLYCKENIIACDSALNLVQEQLERLEDPGRIKLLDTGSIFLAAEPVEPKTPEESMLADKQISLKYSTPFQKCGLTLSFLSFPLWGVAGSVGSVLLPFAVLYNIFDPYRLVTLSCLLVFPLLFMTGVALTACFFDNALVIGESGLSFPLHMALLMQFRREKAWAEVSKISFRARDNQPLEQGQIYIQFGSRRHVPVDLRYFSRADLEMFLLSLNIWGQRIEQDPEIRLLQEKFSNHKLGLQESSFTRIWEEEMNRRFSSTSFVPLQPGQELQNGRLMVVKQLAFGGMAAIYLCQVNKTDLVVLKEFAVPGIDSELQAKARELFEREARILLKLSHPCLARVHDYFVESGRTYLLLDYIPGTDLRQLVLQNGRQPESLVVQWARQVATILKYLHAQQPPVVHRDLTPDNVLLSASERIMLIDFGAANEFVGAATGTLVGKESFIAPEQFRGDAEPRSDIYSLGATLYYLLTAEEPQPLSQSFPREKNPEISAWMNDLVADCTACETEQRIASADALKLRLSMYTPEIAGLA